MALTLNLRFALKKKWRWDSFAFSSFAPGCISTAYRHSFRYCFFSFCVPSVSKGNRWAIISHRFFRSFQERSALFPCISCPFLPLSSNLSHFSSVRYVYQHHTVKVIDDMMCDILEAADPFFHVAGANGASCSMSESVEDMCVCLKSPLTLCILC